VPDELIERIFTVAGKSPSNCNAQPWITHVASGETLRKLRTELVGLAETRPAHPVVPITEDYIEPYRRRRIDAAITLYNATGVTREDSAGRSRLNLRNYAMFDAPHAAFFYMLRDFGMREAADLGVYAQTLMLALTAHGLGSCPQGTLSYYPDAVKRALGVSDDLICLFGLSFGYPDPDHETCAAITPRAPLADTVVFHR
jgi:nitroreductase